MLRSLKSLQSYKILAKDGMLGKTHDFYFDDQSWTIRYLVVDTQEWLGGRKVLISSSVLKKPHWALGVFSVDVKRDQIKNSPNIDVEKPVSRQKEQEIIEYFKWQIYWDKPPDQGSVPNPESQSQKDRMTDESLSHEAKSGPNLKSIHEVRNFHVQTIDDEAGQVADFIVEDESWIIRYIVVKISDGKYSQANGKKVLLSPLWIAKINWDESNIYTEITVNKISNSPNYNPSAPVNREYEVALFDYYGRPKYWFKN